MALVSALLELQERTSAQNGNGNTFKTARARIKSMALAHEALYQNESFSNISMKEYIQRISNLTHRSFINKNADIDLKFNLEDARLEMSKSIPLGLVINEILINAPPALPNHQGLRSGKFMAKTPDERSEGTSDRSNKHDGYKKCDTLQASKIVGNIESLVCHCADGYA